MRTLTFRLLALLMALLCSPLTFAEGLVPTKAGYVYIRGQCGLDPLPTEVRGSSPAQVYKLACRNSRTQDVRVYCISTMTQTFSDLGPQTSPWIVSGSEYAYFAYSYARRFMDRATSLGTCNGDRTITGSGEIKIYREVGLSCPANASLTQEKTCLCDKGFRPSTSADIEGCIPYVDRLHHQPPKCQKREGGFGDPIYPLTGSNTLEIELGQWFGEAAVAQYDSLARQPNATAFSSYGHADAPSFGVTWNSTYHKRIVSSVINTTGAVQVSRGNGVWISFVNNNGIFTADPGVNEKLVSTSSGWMFFDAQASIIETYDLSGRIRSLVRLDGSRLDYSYDESIPSLSQTPGVGLINQITDGFGRKVRFVYQPPGYIEYLVDTANQKTVFDYDLDGNLVGIVWPDGKFRQFVYDAGIPGALTAVIDENGAQTTTFGYDGKGRAKSTEQAGGVNRYVATYTTPPSWTVTESAGASPAFVWRDYSWNAPQGVVVTGPNGQQINLSSSVVQGTPRPTSRDQPAGSGCNASSSSITYDTNGNRSAADDFNGFRTCYAHDSARNLETSRVEGLAAGTACGGLLASGAVLPANTRKTSTQWHPDWRLPVKVAQPKLLTTYVYNGQLDPFTNQAAVCAPDAPPLPDGKPVVVLCKQVEQATTDASGAQGFNAVVDATVPKRERSWTYNEAGQVLTERDPRDQTTTYSYYADSTGDYMKGDLFSVTNAKSQIVRYTKYSPAGKWLEMKDVNDALTVRVFDERQRLKSLTTEGRVTSYEYWPTGLLKTVTLPDGKLTYRYDDAHRLTSITDHLGNSVTYTLDNSGNRTEERTKDPNGALAKTLMRVPDSLNRVQQVTGRQ